MLIYIHIDNWYGDSMDLMSCAVPVNLPALPRKGDVLILSREHDTALLGRILRTKETAQQFCNLLYKNYNGDSFFSLQGFFNVKDVWFRTENGGSVHLLLSEDERKEYTEITDTLYEKILENFKKEKMYY